MQRAKGCQNKKRKKQKKSKAKPGHLKTRYFFSRIPFLGKQKIAWWRFERHMGPFLLFPILISFCKLS